MKKPDFRKNDILRLRRDLEKEDSEKIVDFVKNQHDSTQITEYVKLNLKRATNKIPPVFQVVSDGITKKTKTPFVVVRSDDGTQLIIQARYFKLLMRQPKHPLTSQFLEIGVTAPKLKGVK